MVPFLEQRDYLRRLNDKINLIRDALFIAWQGYYFIRLIVNNAGKNRKVGQFCPRIPFQKHLFCKPFFRSERHLSTNNSNSFLDGSAQRFPLLYRIILFHAMLQEQKWYVPGERWGAQILFRSIWTMMSKAPRMICNRITENFCREVLT